MPRGKRAIFSLVLFCFAIALAVGLRLYQNREPSYQGKPLNEWLKIYITTYNGPEGPQSARALESAEAVIQIGERGVPCLVKWISFEPAQWPFRVYGRVLRKFPLGSGNNWLLKMMMQNQALFRSHAATIGFEVLGSRASSAAPALTRLAKSTRPVQARMRALRALSCVGPSGVPPLLTALSDRDPNVGFFAAANLSSMTDLGSNGPVCVAALVRAVEQNPRVAQPAIVAIGKLGLHPEVAVPALIRALKHPSAEIRIASAISLGEFGERAGAAIPALTEALSDPNFTLRGIAADALKLVAPETGQPSPAKPAIEQAKKP
jgi:HEAT repeat protein